MFKNARYIHVQTPYHSRKKNGFTAKISPAVEGDVELQVSFCAKEDQFCRKTGRKAADAAPVYVIPITNLPARLAEFSAFAEGDTPFHKEDQQTQRWLSNQYAWIWKYFL